MRNTYVLTCIDVILCIFLELQINMIILPWPLQPKISGYTPTHDPQPIQTWCNHQNNITNQRNNTTNHRNHKSILKPTQDSQPIQTHNLFKPKPQTPTPTKTQKWSIFKPPPLSPSSLHHTKPLPPALHHNRFVSHDPPPPPYNPHHYPMTHQRPTTHKTQNWSQNPLCLHHWKC